MIGARTGGNVLLLVVTLFLTVSSVACVDDAPHNFNDCILKNMRGVTNNMAAAEIKRSCREKFPEPGEEKEPERELDDAELAV